MSGIHLRSGVLYFVVPPGLHGSHHDTRRRPCFTNVRYGCVPADGSKLGVVYDVVIDTDGIRCTHLFVRETDHELVEVGSMLQYHGVGSVEFMILCY